MSVDRGGPEVTFQGREVQFCPVHKSAFTQTSGARTQTLKLAPRPPASLPSNCQREMNFVLGFQSRYANSLTRGLE